MFFCSFVHLLLHKFLAILFKHLSITLSHTHNLGYSSKTAPGEAVTAASSPPAVAMILDFPQIFT